MCFDFFVDLEKKSDKKRDCAISIRINHFLLHLLHLIHLQMHKCKQLPLSQWSRQIIYNQINRRILSNFRNISVTHAFFFVKADKMLIEHQKSKNFNPVSWKSIKLKSKIWTK